MRPHCPDCPSGCAGGWGTLSSYARVLGVSSLHVHNGHMWSGLTAPRPFPLDKTVGPNLIKGPSKDTEPWWGLLLSRAGEARTLQPGFTQQSRKRGGLASATHNILVRHSQGAHPRLALTRREATRDTVESTWEYSSAYKSNCAVVLNVENTIVSRREKAKHPQSHHPMFSYRLFKKWYIHKYIFVYMSFISYTSFISYVSFVWYMYTHTFLK